MIGRLLAILDVLRALPGLPLRLAEVEMHLADLEHDADRIDAVVGEFYVGPTERAA